jgi:hypothetical protein
MDQLIRVFETTIAAPELGVRYDVIAASGPEFRDLLENAGELAYEEVLSGVPDVRFIARWSDFSDLPTGDLASTLALAADFYRRLPEEPSMWEFGGSGADFGAFESGLDPRLQEFAAYVSSAPLVTFEGSDFSLQALATIAGKVGLGGAIGLAVAGPTPLLFITVPAGIIVVAVAGSVGEGLGEVLKSQILRLKHDPNA